MLSGLSLICEVGEHRTLVTVVAITLLFVVLQSAALVSSVCFHRGGRSWNLNRPPFFHVLVYLYIFCVLIFQVENYCVKYWPCSVHLRVHSSCRLGLL